MNAVTRRRLLLIGVIALVVVLVAVAIYVVSRPHPTPTSSPAPSASVLDTPSPGSATPSITPRSGFLTVPPELLAKARADFLTIIIKSDVSMTGYSRDQFGAAWTDNCTTTGCDNSCDTRNDILARDLVDETLKSDGCTVLTGILHDAYTGKDIAFVRGAATSGKVQIDHIVPLGDAWRTGAQVLPKGERVNLANDPLNLVAVDGPTNGAKSDSDAADWLPPQANAYCAYAVHQVEVKFTYHLWMSQTEHDVIAGLLAGC